jgi:MFS transporter, ACS family, tartrate transporter
VSDPEPEISAGSAAGLPSSTMRRVGKRLIPFLLLCYFISFLDRINVSFAALQMNRDLGFTPAVYGFGAGLFFLTYCAFELPSNLMLYRFGATRWIARIMFVWGLCAAGMALVTGPASFYGMRLLLGAAEAGFFPGVLFFLTLWFPAAQRGRVIGLFMTGVAISGLIGSPVSGLLLSLDGLAGLRGWQWLFILEGVPAMILAPLCLVYLQDGPAQANWLPAREKAWLAATLTAEQRFAATGRAGTGGSDRKVANLRALLSSRVLLLVATYFSDVAMVNGILFFLPMILKGFGLSNIQTGFVAAIPNAAALVAVIWWGRRSDARNERYGHAAFANVLAGAALLASVLLTDPVSRIVAITIAFAATLSFTAPFWTIPPTFLSGVATAGGYGAISSLGVIGGFVAPTFIGYLSGITGDFRGGLGAIAVLGIVMGFVFYVAGRRLAGTERNDATLGRRHERAN